MDLDFLPSLRTETNVLIKVHVNPHFMKQEKLRDNLHVLVFMNRVSMLKIILMHLKMRSLLIEIKDSSLFNAFLI